MRSLDSAIAAAQPPGLQDRVHEFNLLLDSLGRLAAAESPHPSACIAKGPRQESPPLIAIGPQRLALRQHVLVPHFRHEDGVLLRPDLGVAAGGARDLLDAFGIGRPTGVPVIHPQQRRSFHHPARGVDRSPQIFALQIPKHGVTAKRVAERVRIPLQTADCRGRVRDDCADRVHVRGDEVKPAARPPHMLTGGSGRAHQLLHLADHFTPADESPRCSTTPNPGWADRRHRWSARPPPASRADRPARAGSVRSFRPAS